MTALGRAAANGELEFGEFLYAELRDVGNRDTGFRLLRRNFKILIFETARDPNIFRALCDGVADGLSSRAGEFKFGNSET